MKPILIVICFTFLSACNSPLSNKEYDFGDEIEIGIGETVIVGGESFLVEFVDVFEDSRCPSNVTCVWAGNAAVQVRLANDELRLNTYLEPREATMGNINVKLVRLEPYPEYPRQFQKEDYKIHLVLTKR